MKRNILISSIIASSVFAVSTAFAGPYDGHPDLEFSILNDLDKPAYVGTSRSADRIRIDPFDGTLAGNPDLDQSGFVVGTEDPERGEGDMYGSALYDVGAIR